MMDDSLKITEAQVPEFERIVPKFSQGDRGDRSHREGGYGNRRFGTGRGSSGGRFGGGNRRSFGGGRSFGGNRRFGGSRDNRGFRGRNDRREERRDNSSGGR